MHEGDGEVIPFPLPVGDDDDAKARRELIQAAVAELMAKHPDPAEAFAAVMGSDFLNPATSFAWPAPVVPVLLPRRTEVVTYRVRVDLAEAEPPIWRRLDLPSDLTLDRFHEILQAAMGWEGYHLHAFVMGPSRDLGTGPFPTGTDPVEEPSEAPPEYAVRLDEVLAEPGEVLFYDYDFGDDWEHTIKLEKILPREADAPLAHCLTGRRSCPQEDVGGISHYNDVARAWVERAAGAPIDDVDMNETLEWLPQGFDPAGFDVEAVNERLEGAASKGHLALPPLAGLNDAVVDLVGRVGGTGEAVLARMLSQADLLADTPPEPDVVAHMMQPYMMLIDVCRGSGAVLTAAGYLKPALVKRLIVDLNLDTAWIGTARREDQTYPVLDLRTTATALGLVRKNRGRLMATKAGLRMVEDPAALWKHITSRLPLGKKLFERDAGVLALLAVAGGAAATLLSDNGADVVMADARWRTSTGESLTGHEVYRTAEPTVSVLLGARVVDNRFLSSSANPGGAQFARDALRSSRV